MVVELRDGDDAGLKAVERPVESVPIVSAAGLALSRWAADESLSPWGSTLLGLLPPAPRRGSEAVAPPPEPKPGAGPPPELWVGAGRETRLAEHLARSTGSALLIAPTREDAADWARRVDAARLDSGVPDAVRRASWFAASRGRARVLVGNRAALLTPLPPPATLVLLDEHDPAHKPPGPPHIHARELLLRRAQLDGSRLLLLSSTPSAESWWQADRAGTVREDAEARTWPEIVTADTRRILRNHPLTLPLTRAIEDATRRGLRAALIVSRRAASLVCAECGTLLRCPDCGVPLAYSRAARALSCRLCARAAPMPDGCPGCGGHKLSPLGWDAERVEASVVKRFPRIRVSRSDVRADVVIGPAPLLRRVPRGTLGCVGVVTLDSLLGMPDFRGGERAFQLLWGSTEALVPGGRLVVQTLHPDHYAVQAVRDRERATFYKQELQLRAELGYPPFRRLCRVSARGHSDGEARARAAECARALDGIAGLAVYPAAPLGGGRSVRWQFLVKGPADLPRLIAPALSPVLAARRRSGAVIEVEMDPV